MRLGSLLVLLGCSCLATANVEKVVFLAPEAGADLPNLSKLEYLRHNTLLPLPSSLQVSLPAAFPEEGDLQGRETWFMLEGIGERQRYEVRICWAATVSETSMHILLLLRALSLISKRKAHC